MNSDAAFRIQTFARQWPVDRERAASGRRFTWLSTVGALSFNADYQYESAIRITSLGGGEIMK